MLIILHTAGKIGSKSTLAEILRSTADVVELDLVFPRNGKVAYWSHNLALMFHSSGYLDKKGYLPLEEILEANKGYERKLMIDMKFIPKRVLKSDFFKRLNDYAMKHGEIQIATLDPRLLGYLLKNREELAYLKPGLIVNVLSRRFVSLPICAGAIEKLDFLSLSAELWQRRKGRYVKKVARRYPNVKRYAWVWSAREKSETDELIRLFIEMGADGILAKDPEATAEIIKNYPANT